MCSRLAASAGLSGIAAAMALSGALVAFHGLSAWWSIVTAMLVTATITFLMLASWTDPGYMQKYSDRDPLIDILFERARPVLQNTRSLRVSVEYQGDTYHRFLHDGSWVREEPGLRRGHRYCGSCHIWRPPHAHHCQHCQRCVQNFDHHCDVLHICVGGLNHRWFTLFLLSALAGALVLCGGGARTIFLLGFHHLQDPPWQFWGAVVLEPFYMYAALCSCVGCMHLGLMCAVVSTKDMIQYGCGTCNDRACGPGGCSFMLGQWRRQWCAPVRCLKQATDTGVPRRPHTEVAPEVEPLLAEAV